MAAREIVDGEQEIVADGHIVRFVETFPNFLGSFPRRFERSFTFHCDLVPTSWSIQVTFGQVQDNGNVPCGANVQRTDRYGFSCYAYFWMRALTPMEDVAIRPEHLTRHVLMLNARESQIFHDFIPAQVVRELDSGQLLLKVLFRIRGCHRNKGIARDEEGDVFFMAGRSTFLSKM